MDEGLVYLNFFNGVFETFSANTLRIINDINNDNIKLKLLNEM